MDDDEGLYLMHTREFISTNVPIYKIGRSNQLDNRVKQYPNGSKIMLMIKCKNSVSCENNLKKLFKSKFIQKTYYGSEYFEGNYVDMIKEICDYVNNVNVLFTDEINKLNKLKKVKKVKKIKKVEQKVEQIVEQIIEKKVKKKVEKKIVKIENKDINTDYCDRTCIKCKTKFRYPSTLKTHLESSSRCSISPEEINNFFLRIKSNVHPIVQPVVQPIIQPIIQPIVQPIVQQINTIKINNIKINKFNCNTCNKLFTRKSSLLRHIKSSFCSKFKNIK